MNENKKSYWMISLLLFALAACTLQKSRKKH